MRAHACAVRAVGGCNTAAGNDRQQLPNPNPTRGFSVAHLTPSFNMLGDF